MFFKGDGAQVSLQIALFPDASQRTVCPSRRPVEFGEALAAGAQLTLFSNDKPARFFRVIKFWLDETSGIALALRTGVLSY
jgi:hypothetical protein